jgi:hypothetical protein
MYTFSLWQRVGFDVAYSKNRNEREKRIIKKKYSRMKNRLSNHFLLPHQLHPASLPLDGTQGETFKRQFGLCKNQNKAEKKSISTL